jgi:hypothetical protein
MPDEKRRMLFTDKVLPFMWEMMQSLFKFTRRTIDFVVIEPGKSKEQYQDHIKSILVNKLGMRDEILPKFAGGDWDYQKFKQWKNFVECKTESMRVEQNAPSPVTFATESSGADSAALDLLADTAAGFAKTRPGELSLPVKRVRCE